jgi:hypothetical protein
MDVVSQSQKVFSNLSCETGNLKQLGVNKNNEFTPRVPMPAALAVAPYQWQCR